MRALPEWVREAVERRLGRALRRATPVGGGCIARATRFETGGGVYFLKYGSSGVARTFAAEARGLRALQAAGSPLHVPAVLDVSSGASGGYLLLEWIEEGPREAGFWTAFGEGLAALHRYPAERFGFDDPGFIGRTPQRNAWQDTWPAFFREQRLAPQAALARSLGRWRPDWDRGLDGLLRRLEEILPARPTASLLHGDLWGGNVLADASGRAVLIDPAAYYGHREADLAMTELFGGFEEGFYAAYRGAWPLEPGYAERRGVYNLYHLINHLNLFGDGYAGSVAEALRPFA